MRAANPAFVEGITSKSVTVDGQPVATPRVQSIVFEVALPEDNVFDAPCIGADLGNVPGGRDIIAAVDDGFYATVGPLQPGGHTVRIKATNPSQGFVEDVTYKLTVVRVSLE
jgi:hypothetical protein